MKDLIEFGKIVKAHGLKGDVKVYSYSDNNDNILKLKKVYISGREYKVQSMKMIKNMFLMKLSDVNDIDQTQPFIDKIVYREVVSGESNEDDGFFVKDLIGIEVFEDNGQKLGVLKEVFQTGANDVYEVIDSNNKSIYLPALKDVIKNIDINSKKMVVKLMEGLI